MNKMAEVAKLFGKELEEKFTIVDDKDVAICDACFTEAGLTCFLLAMSAPILKKLLTGTYRIKETPWKAKRNEIYFTPLITSAHKYTEQRVAAHIDDILYIDIDDILYNHGLMCKTSEQAEELSKLLIKTARQFQGFDEE